MRRFLSGILIVAVLTAVSVTAQGVAQGADIGVNLSDATGKLDPQNYRDALIRRAVLYALRAHFNVISRDDIPELLQSDAAHLSSLAKIDAERDSVDRDLVAEGSYYIVSLRYLIEFGSANWPTDRSSSSYQNDALVVLESLEREWLEAVDGGGDLLGVLHSVDLVNAWTEGSPVITQELDTFSDLEALVESTIINYGPWTKS